MRYCPWVIVTLLPMLSICLPARAQQPQQPAQQEFESVYAPPGPLTEDESINLGAVHLDLDVRYMTDYVWRGIERFDVIIDEDEEDTTLHEDAANLQFDGTIYFDLGKAPHPFVNLFINTQEADPVSNFEEIRPTVGLDWNLRPLLLEGGHISYIFQDRDEIETSEVYGKITVDDSYFLRTKDPILSPFVYGAYDYDLYKGWYFEAGVEHVFEFEDLGLILTAEGLVAYTRGMEIFADDNDDDSGFKHYQIGLTGKYSLNKLFDFSPRYGDWSINAYVYYTDGIENDLRTETQLWGGAGIGFSY